MGNAAIQKKYLQLGKNGYELLVKKQKDFKSYGEIPVWLIFIGLSSFLGILMSAFKLVEFNTLNFLAILLFSSMFILLPIWLTFGKDIARNYRTRKLLDTLLISNITIHNDLINITPLNTIMNHTQIIYEASSELIQKKELFEYEGKFWKLQLEYYLAILTDLRSDLQIRLEEQQQTLEQAKSEVEQNIKGTSELSQVSELQKARLDRQIEQFEELQRVLVKV